MLYISKVGERVTTSTKITTMTKLTLLTGLPVSIYKSPLGDSTANGLSSKHSRLLLVGESIEQVPFKVPEGEDYLVAVYRERFDDVIAIPKSILDEGVRPMFGGNFAYSSDSRFTESAPIKIHDRVER